MTEKKEHAKPEIKEVKLAADEAVLTNCKTQTAVGPNSSPCADDVPICSEAGS